jgi:hypothetical protein
VQRGPGDLRSGAVGVRKGVVDGRERLPERWRGVVGREGQPRRHGEHGLVDPRVRGGEVQIGPHPRQRRGVHRPERRGEVAELTQRHRVDEGLATGEGRVVCVGIIALGARFVLALRPAMLGFGVAPDRLRAMTEAKGVRDITSGVLLLVVWAAAGSAALGWFMVAVALTPVADALIVLTNGGKSSTALGVHGLTAALLVAAGLVLALG